jgi:hypothetical protein
MSKSGMRKDRCIPEMTGHGNAAEGRERAAAVERRGR